MPFNWLAGVRAGFFFSSRMKPKRHSRLRMKPKVAAVIESLELRQLLTPVVAITESGTYPYVENDPATAITSTLSVTDSGSPPLAWATVQLYPNYFAGEDSLILPTSSTIASSWNSTNGTLTLTPVSGSSASISAFDSALNMVTYQDTSDAPNTAVRRFQFVVNDGTSTSATVYRYFGITSVNDAPTITTPSSQTMLEDASNHAISGLSFSDADGAGANETITLSVSHGTLIVGTGSGLTSSQITGNNSASVTISAPIAAGGVTEAINTQFGTSGGLTYAPASNYNGTDTLSVHISDLGNTGSGETRPRLRRLVSPSPVSTTHRWEHRVR